MKRVFIPALLAATVISVATGAWAEGCQSGPICGYLAGLEAAADAAAHRETAFRKEAPQRIATLERERAFAYRRLNLIRAIAGVVGGAESEDSAVGAGLAMLRAKVDETGKSSVTTPVVTHFAPVVASVFHVVEGEGEPPVSAIGETLAVFEAWYLATYNKPFWTLFEHVVAQTPVVDF
jgi:hypothetical protein